MSRPLDSCSPCRRRLAAQAARATEYRVELIDGLGGPYARARAVNSSGVTVGEAYTPDRVEHAFHHNGGTRDLGTLGGPGPGFDVNGRPRRRAGPATTWATPARPSGRDGHSPVRHPPRPKRDGVGHQRFGSGVGHAYISASVYHATLWRDGLAHDLGTFGGQYSTAYDINAAGDIVGSADDSTSTRGPPSGPPRAFPNWASCPRNLERRSLSTKPARSRFGVTSPAGRITPPSGTPFGHRPGHPGGEDSWAYDLNDAGIVVGWAELYAGYYHASPTRREHDRPRHARRVFQLRLRHQRPRRHRRVCPGCLRQWWAVRWVPCPNLPRCACWALPGARPVSTPSDERTCEGDDDATGYRAPNTQANAWRPLPAGGIRSPRLCSSAWPPAPVSPSRSRTSSAPAMSSS